MKKTRLISLLLSAVLAASSLPMMATTVAANTDNLLDSVNITAANSQAVTEIAPRSEGNKYLHVYNRAIDDGYQGVAFRTVGKMKAGVEYYVSFYARTSTDVDNTLWMKMQLRSASYENNNPYFIPTECEAGFSEGIVNGGVTNPGAYITLTSEWQKMAYKITLPNVDQEDVIISVLGYYDDGRQNHPFDIDDFRIWTDEDVEEGYIKEEIFDFNTSSHIQTDATEKGCVNECLGTTMKLTNDQKIDYPAELEHASEELYTRISGDSTNNTAGSYVTDITLEAGKYVLSGDVRIGYYMHERFDGSTDLNKANLTVAYNDISLGSSPITNEWSKFEYTILVNEQTTLTSVSLTSNCTKQLDVKNVSLVYDGSISSDNDGPIGGGILMMLLAKKKAAQAAADSTEQPAEPVEANGYLSITNRADGNKGIVYQTEGTIEAGKTYTISFRARAAAGVTDKVGLRLRANTSGNPFILPNENTKGLVNVGSNDTTTYIELTSQWKYFEYTFTTDTAKKNTNFGIYGKATGYNESFEIDDFTITDGADFNESYDFNETAPLGVYGQEPYVGKFSESNLANIHADETTIITHVIEG